MEYCNDIYCSIRDKIIPKHLFPFMKPAKYTVVPHTLDDLLGWIKCGDIAIPEIQRPFVWKNSKVRDLLDSLYQGFPVGYIITWKNPTIKTKDGKLSEGKRILIDGQQRMTALRAAILGLPVLDDDYEQIRIKIAFHPVDERFEVFNTAIAKDSTWIPDISVLFQPGANIFDVVQKYTANNPGVPSDVSMKILELQKIATRQVGVIELAADTDIETVTEIFIRINSQGVQLSQADFAMSKIAANESYGGATLRKCIDYFCHMARKPEFYVDVERDTEFCATEYYPKIQWLKTENDDLYDPDYSDILRVAFTSEFKRGKLSDLVSLLSGRNFETRTFEEQIAEESFARLKKGVLHTINETDFKRFIMIVKSAGFIDSSLIRSQNALNFAYIVYLKMRQDGFPPELTERIVRKWLVMSILTSRYSGSPESTFDYDIRSMNEKSVTEYIATIEAIELSDGFWESGIVQSLTTSANSVPTYLTYLAALCKANTKGLLSKDITVQSMILHRGDVHHIFPKDYLKRNAINKTLYNQVANFAYVQTEINIKIGNKAPSVYFGEMKNQCTGGAHVYGNINTIDELHQNLTDNDIPLSVVDMNIEHYQQFLAERRTLMALRLRAYYRSL